jgi:N-formylglutamate amidohydrolase
MRYCLFPMSLLVALVGLAPAFSGAPNTPKPEDFILIQKGTLPIIISAPHGGRKKVPGVPVRLGRGLTNFQTVLDGNTAELAELFAAELEEQLKSKPWLVVARFERKAVDANRSAEQGYESEQARPLYDAYHVALAAACKTVKKQFGRGLLLDIHGQGEFRDAICRGTKNGKTVTLLKDRDGWSAVTGKRSVLGYLQRIGYKVLPNCDADEKTKEPAKFIGGYIVDTYGSHTGYAIDAIQLEFGSALREKEKDRYSRTAKDLATAVAVFHVEYLAAQK